jgi:hypothetical protein
MALGGQSGGGASAGGVRAGRAYVEMGVKDNITRALATIKGKFSQLGKALAIGGGAGLAAGGGFLAAAIPTLGDLAKLDSTAKAFGLTAEAATGLFGVMGAAGSDVRDATEGLVTLGQRVSDALSGSGEEAKALFDGLGVSADQFAGLNPSEQFYKLHEALTAVSDPAKRVQLLLKAVGEDTGKNLIGTLSQSTVELRKQAAGFSLSQAQLDRAVGANRAYTQATAQIGRVWQEVVIAAAPAVEKLSQAVSDLIGGFSSGQSGAIGDALGESAKARLSLRFQEWANALTRTFVEAWHDIVFIGESLWADFTTSLKKLFVDAVAGMKTELLSVFDLIGRIPGLGNAALGAKVGVGAIAGDPEGVKRAFDKANAEAAAARNKEFEAGRDARERERQAAENAFRLRVQNADKALGDAFGAVGGGKKTGGGLQAVFSSARGLFGNAGGLAGANLGTRGNEMLNQQKKAVDILGDIRGLLQRAKPLLVT